MTKIRIQKGKNKKSGRFKVKLEIKQGPKKIQKSDRCPPALCYTVRSKKCETQRGELLCVGKKGGRDRKSKTCIGIKRERTTSRYV